MEALKQKSAAFFSVSLAKRVIYCLLFMLIFELFLFAAPVLAAQYPAGTEAQAVLSAEPLVAPLEEIVNSLPENNELKAVASAYYTVTAYNSEAAQCDSTPCITANGFNVCEHGIEDTVAANWLPFGAKIRIPEVFGDRVFYVRDRMSKKYSNRVDIWMLDKGEARQFGIKVLRIEVLEP